MRARLHILFLDSWDIGLELELVCRLDQVDLDHGRLQLGHLRQHCPRVHSPAEGLELHTPEEIHRVENGVGVLYMRTENSLV